MNPSLKLINDLTYWLQQHEKPKLTFEDLLIILEKCWIEKNQNELRTAIETFDPQMNGVLTVEMLRSYLVDLGEPLSESEFKDFLKNLPIQEDGTIITEGKLKH
jgi:Ca2+-binding EF-hand superfamily protein